MRNIGRSEQCSAALGSATVGNNICHVRNRSTMSKSPTGVFTVIGARRGTGLEVVRRLTEKSTEQVKEIRAVCRSAHDLPTELTQPADSRIKLVIADASSAESLKASGCLDGAQVQNVP